MAEIIIKSNENEAAELVADFFFKQIETNPKLVLGLATGSTPLKVYELLAEKIKRSNIDVKSLQGFSLDEYVGIDFAHPESYHSIIDNHVTKPMGLDPAKVNVPNGNYETIISAGPDYEKAIAAAGGIDIQILGIGTDGHIGFNEPGSSLASRTRIKTLTEQTRIDNSRFFNSLDEVPTHCITQGIGTIMQAKHLILMAFGESKAEAIAQSVEGGISSFWPASALQMHPRATVVIDEACSSKLKNAQYYKWAFEHKPTWQGL